MQKPSLENQKIGQLTVVGKPFYRQGKNGTGKTVNFRYWNCICNCGKEVAVREKDLKAKHRPTKSCGCIRHTTKPSLKHGLTKSKVYDSWRASIKRCHNPKNHAYHLYGGRGIKVCDRWRYSFDAFLEDMGHPPTSRHSLDRIDTNGDYEPGNCRWATQLEQSNNQRTNRRITFQGETLTIAEWSRRTGIKPQTIRMRLDKYKLSVSEALTRRVRQHSGST